MKYTIQDLREGRCAVINDGTLDELREVLERAFPEYIITVEGTEKFYYKRQTRKNQWVADICTSLPTQSVKDFLKEENKKVCLKGDGTKEGGNRLINYLKSLGGRNSFYNGQSEYMLYYIGKNNEIYTSYNIPEGYTLIELPTEEDNFVLPEKWCVKRDYSNDKVITDYFNSLRHDGDYLYYKDNDECPYMNIKKKLQVTTK